MTLSEANAKAAEILAIIDEAGRWMEPPGLTAIERARERHLRDEKYYYRKKAIQDDIRDSFLGLNGWALANRGPGGAQSLHGKRATSTSLRTNTNWTTEKRAPYADHGDLARIGRRRVAMIEQPYSITPSRLAEMHAWAEAEGLTFTVPVWPSWWYPGATTLCVFTLAGVHWPFMDATTARSSAIYTPYSQPNTESHT